MSDVKHTPGPWTPHKQGIHPYPFICGPAETAEHGEESFLVAYVTGMNSEANARLIAAAPELLAAANDVIEHRAGDLPHSGWIVDCDGSREAVAKLVDAVRKATGAA